MLHAPHILGWYIASAWSLPCSIIIYRANLWLYMLKYKPKKNQRKFFNSGKPKPKREAANQIEVESTTYPQLENILAPLQHTANTSKNSIIFYTMGILCTPTKKA